jgi:glycosyltransferase 2 family protein
VDPDAARPTSGRRGAVRLAGLLVAAAAIAFCAKAVAGQWPQVRHSLGNARPGSLIVALVCSALSMVGLGALWWRCLRLFGRPVRLPDALAWYFGGELGKYLPGGVWSVLGRAELARRDGGISRGTSYGTTLVSYGAMCAGSAFACGLLAAPTAADGRGLGWAWALLALIPLAVLLVHPVVLGRLLGLARRLSRGRITLAPPPWPAMLRLIAWSVPAWLLLGAAAAAVADALGHDHDAARVAFAAIAAWIIGFVVVPVPAGAGLRELVFVFTCGLPAAPAATLAAIARLMLVLVDGFAGLAGLLAVRRSVAPPVRSEVADGRG